MIMSLIFRIPLSALPTPKLYTAKCVLEQQSFLPHRTDAIGRSFDVICESYDGAHASGDYLHTTSEDHLDMVALVVTLVENSHTMIDSCSSK